MTADQRKGDGEGESPPAGDATALDESSPEASVGVDGASGGSSGVEPETGEAEEPSPDAPVEAEGELDLESQLDELAASLDFDLDDEAADEALDEALANGDDGADAGVSKDVDANAPDDPELATSPAPDHLADVAESSTSPSVGDPGDLGPGELPESDGIPSEEVEEVHSMEVLDAEEALELDDTDVEELDSMAELVHDDEEPEAQIESPAPLGADLDRMADELAEPEPRTQPLPDIAPEPDAEPTSGRPLYLVVDGRVATVDQDRFVIGRVSKMTDFAIIDVNISRQHCAIERRDDGYYVVDLGSTNGVVIDGQRVDNHRIEEGDVLTLSSHRVEATFEPPPVQEEGPAVDLTPLESAAEPLVTGRVPVVPREAPAEASGELRADPEPDGLRHDDSLPSPGYRPLPLGLEGEPPTGTQPLEPLPRTETVTGARPTAPAQPHPHAGTAPHPATGGAAPRATMVPGGIDPGFEQRMEMRLEQMSQQIAYLQQSMQVLLAQMQQLQGVAGLAQMIQQRMAAKQGGRG